MGKVTISEKEILDCVNRARKSKGEEELTIEALREVLDDLHKKGYVIRVSSD